MELRAGESQQRWTFSWLKSRANAREQIRRTQWGTLRFSREGNQASPSCAIENLPSPEGITIAEGFRTSRKSDQPDRQQGERGIFRPGPPEQLAISKELSIRGRPARGFRRPRKTPPVHRK